MFWAVAAVLLSIVLCERAILMTIHLAILSSIAVFCR